MALQKNTSLFRATLLLTGVGLISQGLGFLYRIILARLVGAEIMGLYQLIMPAYSVIQAICISGLAVAISVLSSQYYALENEKALRQLVTTGLRGMVLLWLPLALTVLGGSRWIAGNLLGDERTRYGLLLLLPVLLLTGVENLQKQYFYGINSVTLPAKVEIGEKTIHALAVILLVALIAPQSAEAAVALMALGLLCGELFSSSALTLGRLRHNRRTPLRGTPELRGELHRRMVKIALPVSLNALAGNLMGAVTSVMIPQLLVVHGLSQSQAMSQFGVLLGMTLPLLMVPTAFVGGLSLALQPRLAQLRATNQMHAFRHTAEKAMLSVSFLVLPLIALVATLGGDLGAAIFAEPTVGAYMLPLAISVGAGCYHSILVCVLNALEQQRASAAVSLSCNGLELILTVTLVGRIGMAGFVIAMLLSSLLAAILCLAIAWYHSGVKVNCFRCFSAPTLSALLMGLLVNLGYRHGLDSGLGQIGAVLLWAGLGLAIYLLTMRAQGIGIRRTLRG